MTTPLRHLTEGEEPNHHMLSTLECYLYTKGEPIDVTPTAALINEAVDWWRGLGDWGRLSAAEDYRDWREGQGD